MTAIQCTYVKHGKRKIGLIETMPVVRVDAGVMQPEPFMRGVKEAKRETEINEPCQQHQIIMRRHPFNNEDPGYEADDHKDRRKDEENDRNDQDFCSAIVHGHFFSSGLLLLPASSPGTRGLNFRRGNQLHASQANRPHCGQNWTVDESQADQRQSISAFSVLKKS